VGAEYTHRLSESWSAYGRGTAGLTWPEHELAIEAIAGLRGRW
jgi:hypothetical protein